MVIWNFATEATQMWRSLVLTILSHSAVILWSVSWVIECGFVYLEWCFTSCKRPRSRHSDPIATRSSAASGASPHVYTFSLHLLCTNYSAGKTVWFTSVIQAVYVIYARKEAWPHRFDRYYSMVGQWWIICRLSKPSWIIIQMKSLPSSLLTLMAYRSRISGSPHLIMLVRPLKQISNLDASWLHARHHALGLRSPTRPNEKLGMAHSGRDDW